MFNATKVSEAYKHLIGWRQFYDTEKIEIDPDLLITESGEYYQGSHPALQLDIIQTLLPPNKNLSQYLRETIEEATSSMFNDLLQYRQLKQYGKTLLEQSVLLNKYGWINDKITNQSRFVGFQIRPKELTGLKAIINEIGLQFVGQESFTLYLFHSSKTEPLQTLEVETTGGGQWDWKALNFELTSFEHLVYNGGVFVLGYYQDHIVTNAVNYTGFDWDKGVCGGCNNTHYLTWKSIQRNFLVYPLYVPFGSYVEGEMFDMQNAIYESKQSFGLNLKFTVVCDLTEFFIQNKFAFKNLLSLKVVYKILNDMKFSQQINYVEENIKMMIIRDLEGDIDTKLLNIPTRYTNELKAVSYNISGINSKCLSCENINTAPTFGVV